MVQTKKKPTTKKPIKVQLSKDDLKELFTVLKNFLEAELRAEVREGVLAEFSRQGKRLFLNSSENAKKIAEIEAREEKNAKTIAESFNRLEYQNQCGAKYGHRFTLSWERFDNLHFHCINCDLEYAKTKENLTKEEKNLIEAVLLNENRKEKNENPETGS